MSLSNPPLPPQARRRLGEGGGKWTSINQFRKVNIKMELIKITYLTVLNR